MKKILASIVLIAAVVLSAMSVSAEHDTQVSISPDIANCGDLSQTFTVSITNLGPDSVREVRIYDDVDGDGSRDPGIVDFQCGAPPDGWTLDDRLALFNYCQYEIAINDPRKIDENETEEFTFTATLDDTNSECGNEFKIATIDDKQPLGEVVFKFPFVQVDCSDPEVTKVVGEPRVLMDDTCNPDVQTCDFWITQSTVINVSAVDDDDECDLGIEYCQWRYTLDDNDPEAWETIEASNGVVEWNIQFDEDSEHFIEIECFDLAGNKVVVEETDKVDDTEPETTLDFDGPYKQDQNGAQWIDGVSTVILTAADPDPTGFSCNIGVDKTWYFDRYFGEKDSDEWDRCYDPETYCDTSGVRTPYQVEEYAGCIDDQQDRCAAEFGEGTPEWYDCVESNAHDACGVGAEWKLLRPGEILGGFQESCHSLYYFSVDHLGNKEAMQAECFFVDKTPPVVNHDVGSPSTPCDGDDPSGCESWVTTETPITLTCEDVGPHPSNSVSLWYRVWDDISEEWSEWIDPNGDVVQKEIFFGEDSVHKIEYYCYDAVNKTSGTADEPYVAVFRVDATPPVITKTVDGPQVGDCPPEMGSNDSCYVTDETIISIGVEDPDPTGNGCNVDDVACSYEIWWEASRGECDDAQGKWDETTGLCLVESGLFEEPGTDVSFSEDSRHILKVWCEDALGNEAYDEEVFLVDITPPETTKTYGEPRFPDEGYGSFCSDEGCGFARWITSLTPVTLSVYDEKVGNETTYWRNLYISDPVEANKVCGHIKDEAPLKCGDAQKCRTTNYCNPEYYLGVVEDPDVPFQVYEEPFFKEPESCHVIEYYSVDALGNEEPLQWQCVFVDNSAPIGMKDVSEPSEFIGEGGDADCSNSTDPDCGSGLDWFVGQDSVVTLSCDDPLPHPVEYEDLCYKISYEGDSRSGNVSYLTDKYCDEFGGEFDNETGYCCVSKEPVKNGYDRDGVVYSFSFLEDSIHNVEYVCEDALGNTNDVDVEWFAVDTKPPVTELDYLAPVFEVEVCEVVYPDDKAGDTNGDGNDTGEVVCHNVTYIDTASRVNLSAEDPQPHPSGLQGTYYRYTLVKDVYCQDPEQYCQPIHDASNLSEWMLFNGTPFGIPEESCHMVEYFSTDNLENDEAIKASCVFVDKKAPEIEIVLGEPYYQDANGSEYINAFTPISVDVVDPQPHPSGVADVSYRVSLVDDASCYNTKLCAEAEGEGEFSSLSWENESFTIDEESCHLIEVHAVDHVGKENTEKRCVFVDTTPPVTAKTVDDPKSPMSEENMDLGETFYPDIREVCEVGEDGETICWDITLLTPINLACEDQEPHPSGATSICFQVGLDGEDATQSYCEGEGRTYNESGDGYCCVEGGVEDFLFNEETWHRLSYYCVDNVGNVGEDVDTEYFKVEGKPFKISLFKKWNLISVPFVLLNDDPDAVFGQLENVDSVWAYDPTDPDADPSGWLVWSPDGPSNLDAIRPGYGYWVLMREDEDLLLGGSLFQPGKVPPSRTLLPGWNLIGYYGTQWQEYDDEYDYTAICEDEYPGDTYGSNSYCALNSLVDTQEGYPRWSSVWTYINCGGHNAYWSGVNTCGDQYYFEGDNVMYAGRGYWVELDVEDIYAPATSCVWNSEFQCVWPGAPFE